jgi:hypothetical protein
MSINLQNLQKTDFILRFGKYKGEPVSALAKGKERSYLVWVLQNVKTLTDEQKRIIKHNL